MMLPCCRSPWAKSLLCSRVTSARHLAASVASAAALELATRKSTYSLSVRPSIQSMVSTGQAARLTWMAPSSQVVPDTYGLRSCAARYASSALYRSRLEASFLM